MKLKNVLKKMRFQDVVSFVAFLAIFLFFSLNSYNPRSGIFTMLTLRNLTTIVEQTIITLVVASGTMFVVAQGSTDLSVGVNLALAGVVGSYISHAVNIPWLIFPITLVVGLALGVFNGLIVSKFKVSSFMLTLAMLIGVRGLVNYLQTFTDVQALHPSLGFLQNNAVKIPLFLAILAVMWYVFEYTKVGRYSRAIGENETTARFVGIPVDKMKVAAFALSGLMAAVGAIFYIATVGSTSNQMGSFLEIRVVMAIYLGGVLVTGGSSAKFYKLLLGSFSIQIIVTGLALMGKSDAHYSQSVQGILLLLILFLSAVAANKKKKAAKETTVEGVDSKKAELQ